MRMVSCIKSCNLKGMETEIIYAECDIARGLPVLNIVGLPDTSVKEAKEDGHIKNIATIDRSYFGILWLFGRSCLIIQGN